AEAIGSSITLIIPEDRWHEEDRLIAAVTSGQRVEPFETIRRRKDGALIDVAVTISPVRTREGAIVGASKIVRDISERRRSERMREELIVRERRARDEAVAARDRLAFLADVGTMLSSSLDYEVTLDRAVHLALPRLGDYCNVLVEDDRGQLQYLASGHVDGEKEPVLRELALRLLRRGDRGPTMPADAIMQSGQTRVVSHEQLAEAAAAQADRADAEILALGRQLDPYAYLGAPLRIRGRVVGVLSFGTTRLQSARDYTGADVALAEEFAR